MLTEEGLVNNYSQPLGLGHLTLQTQENQALTFPAFPMVHYRTNLQVPRNKHSLSRAFQEKLIFLKKRVTYLRVKQSMAFSFRAEITVSLNIRVRLIYTNNYTPGDLC